MNISSLKLAALVLGGALAAAGTSASAIAGTPDAEVPSVKVRFADLDLGKPEGTATLYRRLETAAHVVCNVYEDRLLERQFAWKHCVSGALDRAVAQIGNASLTAYHLARTLHSRVPPAGTLASALPTRP